MNILFWNVRGIGNSETRIALKNFCLSHKPSLIFVAEPMVNFAQIPAWYWPTIGVSKYCINNRGPLLPNLWALWGNDLFFCLINALLWRFLVISQLYILLQFMLVLIM
jgi:hypothetical protein